MKRHGFYCRMYGKDCFLETEQKNRTKKLAEDFILLVEFAIGKETIVDAMEKNIEYVQNTMQKASFEIKTIKNGNFSGMSYYEIDGENFNYGCDACENPMEKCVLVKR